MTKTVRQNMGLVAVQFIKVNADKTYSYLRDPAGRKYKMHSKWNKHFQYFRGREYAAVLTQTVEAKSKSKASYEILGVLAVFESFADAELANAEYWDHLKPKKTDADKLAVTVKFAEWLESALTDIQQASNFYKSTFYYLEAIHLDVQSKLAADEPVPFAIV